MADSLHTDPEQQLIQRLRAEAAENRPEFSEELHRRICRALEQGPEQPARRPSRGWWADGPRWTILGAGAAVATGIALLSAAMLLGWVGPNRPGERRDRMPVVENSSDTPAEHAPGPLEGIAGPLEPNQTPAPQDLEQTPAQVPLLAEEAAVRVGLLVDATLEGRQWAYLDHDLRLGAELLVERLPWELVMAEQTLPEQSPR